MSAYNDGDLIEAEKKEIASSTRFRGLLKLAENANGVKGLVLEAQGYKPMLQWLEDQGFEFTVIERVKPELPTEPFTTILAVYLPAGNANTKTSHLTLLPNSEGNPVSRWAYSNGIRVDDADLPRIQSFVVVAAPVGAAS